MERRGVSKGYWGRLEDWGERVRRTDLSDLHDCVAFLDAGEGGQTQGLVGACPGS